MPKGSGNRFRDFIHQSHDGIVVIDGKGVILEWNRGEEQITGIPARETLGRPLWEVQYRLVPEEKKTPAFLTVAKDKITHGLREGPDLKRVLEEEIQRPDGSRRMIQSVLFAVGRGEDMLAGGITRDITKQKEIELRLQSFNRELERRVGERTAELKERALQLQRLALELCRTEDRERRRIAFILHDDLQQHLASLHFRLYTLVPSELLDEQARERIRDFDQLIKEAIQKCRTLSHDLSPPVLHREGLLAAIAWLAKEMEVRNRLKVDLQASCEVEPDSLEIRSLLFRSVREILFNVVKHSGAASAVVEVRNEGNLFHISVKDNGNGFDQEAFKERSADENGLGLLSIEERMDFLGGRLEIDSALGRGCCVSLCVPMGGPKPA